MLIRKIAMLAALCALALVGASVASAATYVHDTTATGNVLASGSTISGSLKAGTNAVLTSSVGNITCPEAAYGGTVGASGGATVSGTLNSLTFGAQTSPYDCTSTGFSNIDNCSLQAGNAPAISAVSSSSTSGTLTLGSSTAPLKVDCFSGTTKVCTFTSTGASGTFTNSTNELAYSNVAVTGSFPCPSSGNTFSATFNPNTVDATGGTVVLNNTP